MIALASLLLTATVYAVSGIMLGEFDPRLWSVGVQIIAGIFGLYAALLPLAWASMSALDRLSDQI